jgi:hypothetical protein
MLRAMSRETKPPGRTFEERWPHDAAEADYLAGPWVPIALGGLAGLFGLPLVLGAILVTAPLPYLGIVGGALALSTYAVLGWTGRGQRRVARLWRLSAWLLMAAVAGLLLAILVDALCSDVACREASPLEGPRAIATVITTIAVIGTSVGLAVFVDTAVRRIIASRRARSPHAPR